jgi:Na+-transporting NADH:ubiquinone oxidoreductase subunit NqrE
LNFEKLKIPSYITAKILSLITILFFIFAVIIIIMIIYPIIADTFMQSLYHMDHLADIQLHIIQAESILLYSFFCQAFSFEMIDHDIPLHLGRNNDEIEQVLFLLGKLKGFYHISLTLHLVVLTLNCSIYENCLFITEEAYKQATLQSLYDCKRVLVFSFGRHRACLGATADHGAR